MASKRVLNRRHYLFACELIRGLNKFYDIPIEMPHLYECDNFHFNHLHWSVIIISYLFRRDFYKIFEAIKGNLQSVAQFSKCCMFIRVEKNERYFFNFLKRVAMIYEMTVFCYKNGLNHFAAARNCIALYPDKNFFQTVGSWHRLCRTSFFIIDLGKQLLPIIIEESTLEYPMTFSDTVKKMENRLKAFNLQQALTSPEIEFLRQQREKFIDRDRKATHGSSTIDIDTYIKEKAASARRSKSSSLHDTTFTKHKIRERLEEKAIRDYLKSFLSPEALHDLNNEKNATDGMKDQSTSDSQSYNPGSCAKDESSAAFEDTNIPMEENKTLDFDKNSQSYNPGSYAKDESSAAFEDTNIPMEENKTLDFDKNSHSNRNSDEFKKGVSKKHDFVKNMEENSHIESSDKNYDKDEIDAPKLAEKILQLSKSKENLKKYQKVDSLSLIKLGFYSSSESVDLDSITSRRSKDSHNQNTKSETPEKIVGPSQSTSTDRGTQIAGMFTNFCKTKPPFIAREESSSDSESNNSAISLSSRFSEDDILKMRNLEDNLASYLSFSQDCSKMDSEEKDENNCTMVDNAIYSSSGSEVSDCENESMNETSKTSENVVSSGAISSSDKLDSDALSLIDKHEFEPPSDLLESQLTEEVKQSESSGHDSNLNAESSTKVPHSQSLDSVKRKKSKAKRKK